MGSRAERLHGRTGFSPLQLMLGQGLGGRGGQVIALFFFACDGGHASGPNRRPGWMQMPAALICDNVLISWWKRSHGSKTKPFLDMLACSVGPPGRKPEPIQPDAGHPQPALSSCLRNRPKGQWWIDLLVDAFCLTFLFPSSLIALLLSFLYPLAPLVLAC